MTTTLGPKIIRDESLDLYIEAARFEAQPRTGIRRCNSGAWAAVKDGRLLDTFSGVGAKRAAIQRAGTNTVVA